MIYRGQRRYIGRGTEAEYRRKNVNNPIKETSRGEKIIIGCSYSTAWQSNPKMSFRLDEVKGKKALLVSKAKPKGFWIDIEDLIFIQSKYNIDKGRDLLNHYRHA